MLKPNGDRTEIIVITGSKFKKSILIDSIIIDSDNISQSTKVRNLAGNFDRMLRAVSFNIATCRSAWYNLGNITRVRKSFTMSSANILAQAHIASRLDYCSIAF